MSTETIMHHQLNGQGGLVTANDDSAQNNALQWHHLKYTDQNARQWLRSNALLSEHARLILKNSETRPRAHVSDDEVSLCLRGINFNESAQPEDMISIRLWMDQHNIISSSNEGSQSIRRIRSDLEKGQGPKNAEAFLLSLIDNLAQFTDDFVEKMEHKIDGLEDAIEKAELNSFNPEVNALRRQIAQIRRYLLPQKEAIDKLYRQKTQFFSDAFYEQIYLQSDKFMQLIENLDLMRERALMAQEHFMANISHQQNSRLYLLAIISAIFLPLTFLSGLFGMNVGGMPGIENTGAFNYVLLFSGLLTAVLLVWFKISRWF